ncbi:MAG: hypothetical protein PHS37_06690 [Candidatus Omnitrophica bacterium]|nr:hypothetical protein [Candidatus Omnitrophota bacterium]
MKARIYFLIFLASLLFPAAFADQDTENLYASVTVLPNFSVNLDNNLLDFGMIQPGQTVTLKEGSPYNRAICISNKGKIWYLKLSLVGDIIGPAGTKIDPSSVKWKVYDVQGNGSPVEGWQNFGATPVLAYTAGGDDLTGREVRVSLQYSLTLPDKAVAGHYVIRVLYSLTEER